MPFIERINDENYEFILENDYVLGVCYNVENAADVRCQYDFVSRLMFNYDGTNQQVIPFSQLDPETLHLFWKQLKKLGGKPPALPDDIVKSSDDPVETWVDMGIYGIAHVGIYPQMQRKITKIFNFESRQMQTVTENLKTHTETVNPPVSFDDVLPALVENAVAQFEHQGKVADKGFVLRGVSRLDKPGLGS